MVDIVTMQDLLERAGRKMAKIVQRPENWDWDTTNLTRIELVSSY